MRWLQVILVMFLMAFSSATLNAGEVIGEVSDAGAAESPSQKVDVAHMLFGHIGDSYGWHITDWSGKHVTIPLPCIVYSRQSGWHVFMSSKSMDSSMRDCFLRKRDDMRTRSWRWVRMAKL